MSYSSPVVSARLVRRFFGVAVSIAALALSTLGLGAYEMHRVRSHPEQSAERLSGETHRAVQERLLAVIDDMQRTGAALVRNPLIRSALDASAANGPSVNSSVLQAVASAAKQRRSIELYRSDGVLVAWGGPATPLDKPAGHAIPRTPETGVVTEGGWRRTLEVWLPLYAKDRSGASDSTQGSVWIGAVRVLQPAQIEVPVQNRFLQDYSLASEWRDGSDLPFSVLFTERPAPSHLIGLSGPDGQRLGWLQLSPTSKAFLTQRIRERTFSVAAFWLVLLGLWLLAGGWAAADQAMRTAMRQRTRRAWAKAAGLFACWAIAWWVARYGLLALEVPARWMTREALVSALFDPAFLASDVGAGLLRSAGDLMLTGVWGAVFGITVLRFALIWDLSSSGTQKLGLGARVVGVLAAVATAGAALFLYSVAVRHAVLDATLSYFERTEPIPDALTVLVVGALLAVAGAAVAIVAAVAVYAHRLVSSRQRSTRLLPGLLLGLFVGLLVVDIAGFWETGERWLATLAMGLSGVALGTFLLGRSWRWMWPLTFRGMLASVLVLVLPTYSLMLHADRERHDDLAVDAADSFAGGQDLRAVFAIEQVLAEARSDGLRGVLLAAVDSVRGRPDSLVRTQSDVYEPQSALDDLVTGSLLASLTDYSVALALFDEDGDTLAASLDPPRLVERLTGVAKSDPLAFSRLQRAYQEEGATGIVVRRAPAEQRWGAYRYAGLAPIKREGQRDDVWVYVNVLPRFTRYVAETPFPRVLIPAGLFGEAGPALSYAEYNGEVLVRSRGEVPGPSRLSAEVRRALSDAKGVWIRETVEGRSYRTFYERISGETSKRVDVVAVRTPALAYYDHLFFVLRLTVSGLAVGLVVYLMGVPVRRRLGLLPVSRSRFRDKVLTRFLAVGIVSVALTGVIGQQVVGEQHRQSVRDGLRQQLQRVENAMETGSGLSAFDALGRMRADALSQQLGVDVHVYLGPHLASTSRPQLVRQRLIDTRLPASVWHDLFAMGERYSFAEERIGTFSYTTGYAAVVDKSGRPVGAVAIPTLPEQTAIEAERARMVAYLFGALLVLLLGIVVTTTLLANQLTRPFRRLRAGLQAVGAGQIEEPIPVETNDEMGNLVETFNTMQGQLAESRRRLGEQERELAWREMARQVAHEIKNPLTPMKLSVQHLRRAYKQPDTGGSPDVHRFAGLLDRITKTLIEQIDALDRIAGEFSTFARLPRRDPQVIDLSAVVKEAATVFGDERERARGRSPSLSLEADPLLVEADREELRRAFINLFKNALQALSEGQGSVVARTWRGKDGLAYAEVSDTGPGIPEEIRDKIFQPNFSTKTSGMGLGLAIVQKSIRASGGTIDFTTEQGEGTTFTIRLPLLHA